MDWRAFWQRTREEADLDTAMSRTALNVRAKKLQQARAELKVLDAEPAKRPKQQATTRDRGPASS
jgi:hypothetical protein